MFIMTRVFVQLSTFALVAMLVYGASAQDTRKGECSGAAVLGSAEAVTDGERVTFHVEPRVGEVDRSLEYHWNVRDGRIVDGQGTPVIVVSTSGVGSGGSVSATVDFSTRECRNVSTSQPVYVRRKGPRTSADAFWEWLWFNGAKLQFAERSQNADLAAEIRTRLNEVDPDLTLELGSLGDDGKREIIIGHRSKPSDSKQVIDFVARAPNFVIFNVRFKNSFN